MKKHLEIGVPAVLPLAIARLEIDGVIKSVMLGVTLQHPPIHFLVAKHKEMTIYGPRADIARHYAEAYAKKSRAKQAVEIRIDNTSPSLVGFGSEPLIALGAAQAVAWVNGHEFENVDALESHVNVAHGDPLAYWGFKKGGFLLVELESGSNDEIPALIRHQTIEHRSHLAWAFVFHFPKVPENTSESIEQDRMAELRTAVSHMPLETGRIIIEQLWPALEQDDFESFAKALHSVRRINEEVMKSLNLWHEPAESSQKVFEVFEKEGVAAWGSSYTGIAAFGLLYGSLASQEVRTRLLKDVGYFSGQFEATISDIEGAKHTEKEEDLHLHDYALPNLRPGISGPGRNG